MKQTYSRTIAAIATPYAVGGISVIRISGTDAFSVADQVFRGNSGRKLAQMKGYTAAYGQLVFEQEVIDEGIALVFHKPKSYTGEDVVEFSCHGGLLVTRKLLRAVLEAGAVLAEPGEFTKRAFLNGKVSLTQAEAVSDLIQAGNEQGLRIAKNAMQGRLYEKIKEITGNVVAVSGHISAYIDYPEEDMEPAEIGDALGICEKSVLELDQLIASFEKGKLVRNGVETVILGKPNVGKSTLMNLLSGCKKSIVTDIPGTTRDIVEETINLGDVVLRLADTAGIRETDNPVEQMGVEMALERMKQAELILAVFDLSVPLSEEDESLLACLESLPVIAIFNKTDLPKLLNDVYINSKIKQSVYISAQEESGIAAINKAVTERLALTEFSSAGAVLCNERQYQCAYTAKQLLSEAVETIRAGFTLDAVEVAMESAIAALLELSGEKVSDTIIHEVFSHFCVGK